MPKQIFINLPVADVAAATAFYQALGFTKNPMFSDDKAAAMQWSGEITVMLLSRDFYQTFLKDKTIADTTATNSVLLALSMDKKEDVEAFAQTAQANGGSFYKIDNGVSPEMMVGYEVVDLDGHIWEPVWMSPDFNPQG